MSGAPIGVFDSAGDGHVGVRAMLDQLPPGSTGRPAAGMRLGPSGSRPLAEPGRSADGPAAAARRCGGGGPGDIRPIEVTPRMAVAGAGGARAHASPTRAAARRTGVTRPAFMDVIERGETDSRQLPELTRAYLAPFQEVDVDTIIPGCTRYPLLTGVIGFFMGEGVTLASSRQEIVQGPRREPARFGTAAWPRPVVAGARSAGSGVTR